MMGHCLKKAALKPLHGTSHRVCVSSGMNVQDVERVHALEKAFIKEAPIDFNGHAHERLDVHHALVTIPYRYERRQEFEQCLLSGIPVQEPFVLANVCALSGYPLECGECGEEFLFLSDGKRIWIDKPCPYSKDTIRHAYLNVSSGRLIVCQHVGIPIPVGVNRNHAQFQRRRTLIESSRRNFIRLPALYAPWIRPVGKGFKIVKMPLKHERDPDALRMDAHWRHLDFVDGDFFDLNKDGWGEEAWFTKPIEIPVQPGKYKFSMERKWSDRSFGSFKRVGECVPLGPVTEEPRMKDRLWAELCHLASRWEREQMDSEDRKVHTCWAMEHVAVWSNVPWHPDGFPLIEPILAPPDFDPFVEKGPFYIESDYHLDELLSEKIVLHPEYKRLLIHVLKHAIPTKKKDIKRIQGFIARHETS